MTLVSIIITCFNSKDTIERTIKSAISQDWPEKEIIIIDDHSTDCSFELISKLSAKEKQISCIRHNSNKGYPASLNSGIRQSKGEFIAIFDDDDDNLKNRISLQIKRIINYEKENQASIILCYSNRDVFKPGSKKCDAKALAIGRKSPEPNGKEVADYIFGFPSNQSKIWGMFGSCTLMVRKNIFKEVGLFDETFRRTAEWDFAIRAAFKGAHFIAVNHSLIKMYKTIGSEKAGKIPLIYSLKLRDKYKNYLISHGFYNCSKLIARSNFYLNKKKLFIGIFYRILALIISPKLMLHFLKTKIFKLFRSS